LLVAAFFAQIASNPLKPEITGSFDGHHPGFVLFRHGPRRSNLRIDGSQTIHSDPLSFRPRRRV
jgi:hypothetical protein